MKTLSCLLTLSVLTSAGFAQESASPSTAPAAATSQSAPKGEVLKFSYTAGEKSVFPGTTRTYWIYIPAEYDPSKPACLFVDQDRVQFNAPKVFDELIAAREMPVTIGVFVAPGVAKPLTDTALPRFNRSYEFDGLSGDYAKFLLTELLPDAEKKTASDGRPIHLSQNPDDRMIAGSSSGAIASFTVAWERNDSFHRVFSAIGTFVDLRGGNIYPSLIRKFEPKPIRIFLQDGSADHNHYGGDWWMANQEMERAFTFAGYEVNHIYGTGDHDHKQADQIFPDAMRWLWKDWPNPVKAGKGSEQLQQILLPGEDWQLVGDGYHGTDGPAANAQGEVFFNDGFNSKTYKVDLDGKVAAFLTDGKKGGSAFGPDGRLYVISSPQILAYDAGGHSSTIAEGIHGNDVAAAHNGNIYATESGSKATDLNQVWLIRPSGEKKVIDTGIKFPNGIALSPDQSLLYVDDYRSHWVYSYQIQPDGTLADKQKFDDLYVPDAFDDAGGDGMRTDADGRLYVSTRAGIQICDQAGRVVAIIPTPNGRVSNLCFGGAKFDTLFATCGDRVYKRKLKVHGLSPSEGPIKPAPPKL